MATFTTNPNQAARFDLFDISVLDGDYLYEATATTWRAGPFRADLGTNIEFQGVGFTYSGGGALIGGTINTITSHLSGPVRFQFSGLSMSVATFNAHKGANDSQGFLEDAFSGNDTMTGSNLVDVLFGYAGNDHLEGLNGDDVLEGGAGSDTLVGGKGNDTYGIDSTGDVVVETGGDKEDRVWSSIDIDLNNAAYDGVENIVLVGSASTGTGDGGANEIWGNSNASKLSGNAGSDYLFGNGGDDTLDGGSGSDFMEGKDGDDTYYVDSAKDTVSETLGPDSGGNDTIFSSIKELTLPGYVENLTLIDGALNGTGNNLANTLIGNAEANLLDGKAGADAMSGGDGNDWYMVDNAKEKVTEISTGGTADVVLSTVTFTLSDNVETLILQGKGAINGTGNASDNTISGNSAANKISGADGNDALHGSGGNDSLIGGGGNDSLYGGSGNDSLVGGSGDDSLYGGNGNDTLDTSEGNDTVFLKAVPGLDVILGFDGNATDGQDTLNLDGYFDALGLADADRADRIHISKNGTTVNVWVDYDGDSDFDFPIAEIHTVDAIAVGQDIIVA